MRKHKGSFTIEATIVMSSILIILFAVLYAFTIIYQQCLISVIAARQADKASAGWITGNDLYYHIGEFNSENYSDKLGYWEEETKKLMETVTMMGGNIEVNADFERKLFGRNIKITIEQNVVIPFEAVAKFFNDGKPMKLKATAVSKIVEPTEYIRNIDYSTEIISVIADWIGEKLGKIDFIKDASTIFKKLK